MIETPSLRFRVVSLSLVLVVVVVVALDLFVYLSLRERLEHTLQEVLDARQVLVEDMAEEAPDADELAAALASRGIRALVRDVDGVEVAPRPATPRFDRIPPATEVTDGTDAARLVTLADGRRVEVFVSRRGTEVTLQRLLVLEVVGTALASLVAVLLLNRAAAVVARPLERIGRTAQRIAAGDRTQRLAPSDPSTELGQMATAFDKMVDALDAAVTDAEAAEVRSRRFLADAAHQLRTPLAGLRASAEALLADPDGPDRDRLAAGVASEAARMSRLVSSLLRVARLDRGEPLDLHPTDVGALLGTEVERQRALAPAIVITLALPAGGARTTCDADAVREAVANLLDNARRFARTLITVAVETGGALSVVVDDDGSGVDPAVRDEIFDRFRGSGSGSGLGLAIARAIAQRHGGDLVLEGASRFVLRLPLRDDAGR